VLGFRQEKGERTIIQREKQKKQNTQSLFHYIYREQEREKKEETHRRGNTQKGHSV
jgi:hypothetical protein